MEQIYYGITIIIYSIFLIRFILSWIGGDLEFDIDSDLETDFNLNDIISFKGITHFLMGFFGWISTKNIITHNLQWYDYLIAFGIGILFVFILYWIYKLMFKLESKPKVLSGVDLIGHNGKIYLLEYIDMNNGLYHYTVTVNNGIGTVEVSGISFTHFRNGDPVILSDYDGIFYKLNK